MHICFRLMSILSWFISQTSHIGDFLLNNKMCDPVLKVYQDYLSRLNISKYSRHHMHGSQIGNLAFNERRRSAAFITLSTWRLQVIHGKPITHSPCKEEYCFLFIGKAFCKSERLQWIQRPFWSMEERKRILQISNWKVLHWQNVSIWTNHSQLPP